MVLSSIHQPVPKVTDWEQQLAALATKQAHLPNLEEIFP